MVIVDRPARVAAVRSTPENVGSPVEAGLATRVLAFAADALVINAVVWFVTLVVALGLSILAIPDDLGTVIAVIGGAAALLWSIAYFAFFWSVSGQTPGNRLMRIRVADARTAEPIALRRAVLRVVALPLSVLPLGAGVFMILFDARRRALHDRLVRTVVVYVADERADRQPSMRPIERPQSTAPERDETSSLR